MEEQVKCPHCGSVDFVRNGHKTSRTGSKLQQCKCKNCGSYFLYCLNEPYCEKKQKQEVEPKKAIMSENLGISVKDFMLKNHLPTMVEEGVKKLPKDRLLLTAEFAQDLCGINTNTSYRRIEDFPEYEQYHGKASGKVYWSQPETIEQLKKEHTLL